MANRPLSPHLTIYRFAYTMALSILHRATGVLLGLGLFAMVAWLAALAGGSDAYSDFVACAGSWWFQGGMGLLLVAFVYHLANGIRHLFWDVGMGLERKQARRSALFVVVAVLLVSAALLCLLFGKVSP